MPDLNRRAHPRYAVDEDSTLLLVSHGLSLKSHILDLSLEGCRLRLLEPYSVGKGTRVEVSCSTKTRRHSGSGGAHREKASVLSTIRSGPSADIAS